jgi:glutathione S-transferase
MEPLLAAPPARSPLARSMIELIQIPYSPFCIVIRRILDYADARYKVVNIPNDDRTLVWRLTRGRYYQVPVVKDGKQVIFELGEDTQVVAKYLDGKFQLGLFPHKLDGVQRVIWRTIENEVESFTFKLNDVHWREVVPKNRAVGFVRHKERRFGRGCLDQWREQQPQLLEGLARALVPFEEMLLAHPFLLEDRPRFLDFDLYGMLGNFLYSGHYELPAAHTRLRDWYGRMDRI